MQDRFGLIVGGVCDGDVSSTGIAGCVGKKSIAKLPCPPLKALTTSGGGITKGQFAPEKREAHSVSERCDKLTVHACILPHIVLSVHDKQFMTSSLTAAYFAHAQQESYAVGTS